MTLGLAALLLLALCLGQDCAVPAPSSGRCRFPRTWSCRNFGLTIFLAQVGIASGPKFFATVGATGLTFLIYAIVITLTLVLITTIFAMWIFRMPFDASIGVISGATGNPAILAFASRVAPTDRPDVGYAMIFPSMTIGKILFVQIAATLLT